MAQQVINNADSGLVARTKINSNYTELYAALGLPIKIAGMNANYEQAINANAMVTAININPVSGGPVTLRIGVSANGQDVLPDTVISAFQTLNVSQYFSNAGNLFFTFSGGSGSLNVRIDVINNFN